MTDKKWMQMSKCSRRLEEGMDKRGKSFLKSHIWDLSSARERADGGDGREEVRLPFRRRVERSVVAAQRINLLGFTRCPCCSLKQPIRGATGSHEVRPSGCLWASEISTTRAKTSNTGCSHFPVDARETRCITELNGVCTRCFHEITLFSWLLHVKTVPFTCWRQANRETGYILFCQSSWILIDCADRPRNTNHNERTTLSSRGLLSCICETNGSNFGVDCEGLFPTWHTTPLFNGAFCLGHRGSRSSLWSSQS